MATPLARTLNLASDGSGNGDRVSSNLFFSLFALSTGLYLLTLGRRGWRVTTGLALGLTVGLGGWAIAVAAQGDRLLGGSVTSNDWLNVLIFTLCFLFAFALGAWKLWPVGIGMLGLAAGFSLGLQICLLGDDGTIHHLAARYIVIGVLALCALILNVFLLNFTSSFCCSQIGAFLLFLGIDLLVNVDRGWSRGLRFVLDANEIHRTLLRNYDLPVTSRIFVGLAWLFALISSYLQYRFSRSPFIRLRSSPIMTRDIEATPRRDSLSKSPLPPSSPLGPTVTIEAASPIQDTYSERVPSPAPSGRDPSIFSMLTQQFRSHWAGALSQYGSSIDLSSRPSPSRQNSASILHPLRALNPDPQPLSLATADEAVPSDTTRQMAMADTSHFSDTTRATTTAAVLPGGSATLRA